MATPKAPKLDESALYSDNGRITCGALRCAGYTAHATGHGLGGKRLARLTEADAAEWVRMIGARPTCEGCGKGM
jgi:hypothetical protein